MVSRQSWPRENRAADRQAVGALCTPLTRYLLPPSVQTTLGKMCCQVLQERFKLQVTLSQGNSGDKAPVLKLSPKDFNTFMASALSTFKPIKSIFEHSLVSQDTAIK